MISIGIYLVGVDNLVGNELMSLSTLKFHLLFEELVFVVVAASLAFMDNVSILSFFFVESLLVEPLVGEAIPLRLRLAALPHALRCSSHVWIARVNKGALVCI